VSGSIDNTGRVWDAVDQALEYHFGCGAADAQWPLRHVTSVAFASDGKQVVSGSLDETVRLCDIVTGVALAMRSLANLWHVFHTPLATQTQRRDRLSRTYKSLSPQTSA
jgi:WD40 repeat protein